MKRKMTHKNTNTLTRRAFGVAASATAATVAAPFVHSGTARAQERVDVIVIGAGLSGLNAAWILNDAGLSVRVLEGSPKIGGRVWTAEESWETNAGEVPIELGASQIGPDYARVLDIVDRLGLPTLGEDRSVMPFAYHLEGALIKGSEWADAPQNKTVGDEREIPAPQFGSAMLAKFNPLKELDDWFNPRFADFDVSIYDLLKRNGVSEEGLKLASHNSDMHGVSVLRLMQEQTRGAFGQEFYKDTGTDGEPAEHWPKNIKGGTIVLPRAMAGQLPQEVLLNQQVAAIDVGDDSVDVRTLDGNRYQAKFVIATVPFSVLRYVKIWPKPPEAQLDAIQNIKYAETTRAFCTINEPFWEEDGFEPSLFSDGAVRMFWAIDSYEGKNKHRGMFVLTNTMGRQVAAMPPEQASRFLVEELERIRPASKGQIKMHRFHSWERQPLQRGCSPMFKPGQVTAFANEMIVPHGRLHFAGEHTRRLDFGMEAAMESGERAAFEILDRT